MTLKHCRPCGRTLPVAEFSRDASRKDGLCNRCKTCEVQRALKYQAANREKVADYGRKRYAANREKVADYGRLYRQRPDRRS